MPPALFEHLWWLRIVFYAPQCCLGTFKHWGFFLCLLHLPPSVGCDPSQGYFQKILLGSKGDYKGYILTSWMDYQKIAFPHLKHMCFGSVSFAFMRVCQVISHYLFK
jgi:hypothetical protein